ncbi:uncharacterized protein LOC144359840 [Saccoglossus kowalevskii]
MNRNFRRSFLCICICSILAVALYYSYWQGKYQITTSNYDNVRLKKSCKISDPVQPVFNLANKNATVDCKAILEALVLGSNTCSRINDALRMYYSSSDAGREPLPNFYLNKTASYAVNDCEYREANIVFVHLPKAGGTSVENILFQFKPNAGRIRKVALSHCIDFFKEAVKSKSNALQTLYYSKRSYGIHNYLYPNRPVAYVTWFREPIARLISSYYYLKKTHCGSKHVVCKKYLMKSSSLTHYLKRTKRIRLQDMSNYMVRLLQFGDFPVIDDTFEDCCGSVSLSDASKIPIIGEKHYLVAKRNLETKMAFIGLTEDFKTSQEMLAHMFGINQKTKLVHVNANAHNKKLTDYELSELRKRNKWDLKLYEDAKKIYEEQKQNYVKYKS